MWLVGTQPGHPCGRRMEHGHPPPAFVSGLGYAHKASPNRWAGCKPPCLAHPVLPSFLPREVPGNEILQRDAADEVVQAPPSGDMTDDEDPLPVPAQWQVIKEPVEAHNGLPPAFPARIRPV